MENQTRNDEIEIDLLEVFNILISRAWIIIGAGLLLSLTAFAISKFVLTPTYKSTTKIYILNKTESQTVTYSDVQMGTQLTKDYAELINSRYVLEEVIQLLSLDMDYARNGQCGYTGGYTYRFHYGGGYRPGAGYAYSKQYSGGGK